MRIGYVFAVLCFALCAAFLWVGGLPELPTATTHGETAGWAALLAGAGVLCWLAGLLGGRE